MGLRDLARKSLGLFVELPDEPDASNAGEQALRSKSLSELMADLDETSAPRATFNAPPSSAVQDGQVNFAAIYQEAGVAPLAFTAEQTLDLIRALPAELPLSTKRQTLDVSLNTLGRVMNGHGHAPSSALYRPPPRSGVPPLRARLALVQETVAREA